MRMAKKKAGVQALGQDMSQDHFCICVISDRCAEAHFSAGTMRNDGLIEPLPAGIRKLARGEQGLAGEGQSLDLVGEIHSSIAEDQDHHLRLLTTDMNAVIRAGSTSFHHTPSRLSELATITPSAMLRISPTLPISTPEPTTTGRLVASLIARISAAVAASPVRCPVAITTSALKNSASRVSSAMLRSAVMAC